MSFGPLDGSLANRHSCREFRAATTLQKLGDLLWHSLHVREGRYVDGVPTWESRPVPSGGGCHPIHVVALQVPGMSREVLVYDAKRHSFGICQPLSPDVMRRAIADVDKCLNLGRGTILWFVADLEKSLAKYRNPESLVWRDSGALLATISIVAEAIGLNCCGVGFHDIPTLRRALNLERSMLGVGGCILAGRVARKC